MKNIILKVGMLTTLAFQKEIFRLHNDLTMQILLSTTNKRYKVLEFYPANGI